jgi:hypothetical protein
MALQSVECKIALIMGANKEIGLEVAHQLNRRDDCPRRHAQCGAWTRSRRGSSVRRQQRLLNPA